MNLQNILIDATGGFAAGLVVGLAGMPERYGEKLELVELIEERERKELSDEKLKDWKHNIKITKRLFPIVIGGVYSFAASLFSQNPHTLIEKLIVAVPSAYLGRFVGSRIRKFKNKEKLEEQKNEIRARRDFENMHKYFLPKDKAGIIDNAFSEIEKKALDGKQDEIIHDLYGGPFRKIWSVITEKETKYTPLLLAWSLAKQLEVLNHANLQRTITRFYERSYEEMPPEAFSIADCAILGNPENPKIKVFTKEGGDFYVQTVELLNLKIIKDDKTGIVEVEEREKPKIISTEKEIWTDDYKALTDRFLYEKKAENGYTMMLMSIPSGMPEEMRAGLVMKSFLPAYEEYHSERE